VKIRDPNNNPPEISITSPANHSEVSATVSISGTASDEDGDETITKVEISIDEGDWQNVTGTGTWSFEWDTNALEDGTHTIRLRSYDSDDYSKITEIFVDVNNTPKNTKPEVFISFPGDDSQFEQKYNDYHDQSN